VKGETVLSIYKRDGVYWFNFWWDKTHIQRSTRQGSRAAAIQLEANCRTELAKGGAGILHKKASPTLRDFMRLEFMPWVAATFEAKPKTFSWYRGGVRRLSEFDPLATLPLDKISGDKVAGYIAYRRAKGLSTTGINRELQILRRITRVALEWGRVERVNKIKMLPGENRRERVLTMPEEARYLTAASELLLSVATVLLDSGMRPEECFRLRWEKTNFDNGRYGTLHVTHGKTQSARRFLPMTARVRRCLLDRWTANGSPQEGWVFAAPTKSGHVEPSTIRGLHRTALKRSGVAPFVLYSLRHTFLTRLGESGCDAWTLARIAGHSSVAISGRYVHPSEQAVLGAFDRLHGQTAHIEGKDDVVPAVVSTYADML